MRFRLSRCVWNGIECSFDFTWNVPQRFASTTNCLRNIRNTFLNGFADFLSNSIQFILFVGNQLNISVRNQFANISDKCRHIGQLQKENSSKLIQMWKAWQLTACKINYEMENALFQLNSMRWNVHENQRKTCFNLYKQIKFRQLKKTFNKKKKKIDLNFWTKRKWRKSQQHSTRHTRGKYWSNILIDSRKMYKCFHFENIFLNLKMRKWDWKMRKWNRLLTRSVFDMKYHCHFTRSYSMPFKFSFPISYSFRTCLQISFEQRFNEFSNSFLADRKPKKKVDEWEKAIESNGKQRIPFTVTQLWCIGS